MKKLILFFTVLITASLLYYFFARQGEIEFKLAKKLSHTRSTEYSVDYFVVENYPTDFKELKAEILKFHKKYPVHKKGQFEEYSRVYMKECTTYFFDFFDDNESYLSDDPASPGYLDFLCVVSWYKTRAGKDTVTFEFYKDGHLQENHSKP